MAIRLLSTPPARVLFAYERKEEKTNEQERRIEGKRDLRENKGR
jgi:hypothetical protein